MRYFIGFSVRVKIGLLKHSSKFCELLYVRLLTEIVCNCILLRPRKGCEVLRSVCVCVCVCVCVFVCLSVCPLAYLKTTCPNFTKFSVRLTYGRGWRRWSMLCTSGFDDDVMFSHNAANIHCESKKQGTTILSITSPNVDRFSNFFH